MSFSGLGTAGSAILGPTGAATIAQPPSGTIRLNPSRGQWVLLLLASPPDRSGGLGGWQTSERMFNPPARWWQAPPLETLSIAGILDLNEHDLGHSIETRLGWLNQMGLPGDSNEPPTIKLWGDIPPRDRRLTWIMQDITLGDRIMAAPGVIAQQNVTVSLEGFTDVAEVSKASVKRTRASGATSPRRRTVRTKKGDTLRTIAVRELGTSTQYVDIRSWNKQLAHTDPDQPLRAGLEIVLR